MVEPLNTEVYYTAKASSLRGLTSTGYVMAGDRGFEYYNEKNAEDYIQIPWGEIDYVSASVMFGGKVIPRFAIFTKQNGHFDFSTRENHATLRAIREHVPADSLVKSPTFFGVIKHGFLAIGHAITGKRKK
jgi:hypothetical protein